MIFSRLSIENLGVFRGKVEFDLAPSHKKSVHRPIILFGGMNGAGKTTVFEAFKLTLYGPGAFWPPVSREVYEAEMRNRLSRHPATIVDPDRAAVELEVEHSHSGKQYHYTIRREWDFRNKAMKETFEVRRDGVPLREIETSLWQDFVWDLIPPGLSRLFFFDGEKIQSLADDESGTLQLAESFRSLVGLDLVDRLSADLELIVAKELKRAGTRKLGKELAITRHRLDAIFEKRRALLSERAKVQSEIDVHVSRVESRERQIASEGGGWSRQRSGLIQTQTAIDAEVHSIEQSLRDLAGGTFPLAIIPDLCVKTRERIDKEVELEQWNVAAKFAKSMIRAHLENLGGRDGSELDPNVKQIVARIVQGFIDEALSPPRGLVGDENLNQLSPRDAIRVSTWFEDASKGTAGQVRDLCLRREDLVSRQQDVAQRMAKVPIDAQLAPMVSEFNALHGKLSGFRARLATFDSELARIEREIEGCQRQIERVKVEAFKHERLSAALEAARRVGAVLKDFQEELTHARISQVTGSLEQTFRSLSRKKGWLGGVRVDPKSFAVTLLDRDGRSLPKERLAAGEKQIYAVALLWALAKASGRSLPFIIDTPLGRLDSTHRRSLISSFLPFASEQVIVFSTDTEIDRPYFDALAPHIARSYHLVHDEGLGMTKTESGYFWRPESEAVPQ
jgi:DNA sulfur modification protein DndD